MYELKCETSYLIDAIDWKSVSLLEKSRDSTRDFITRQWRAIEWSRDT